MDLTELIDRAARAAVEHEPNMLNEICSYFGTHRRPDGLFAISDRIIALYFPGKEDAEAIERAGRGVIINGENVPTDPEIFPAHLRPESAFRSFNYTIATALGEHPVATREKINAAIMRGDIH